MKNQKSKNQNSNYTLRWECSNPILSLKLSEYSFIFQLVSWTWIYVY